MTRPHTAHERSLNKRLREGDTGEGRREDGVKNRWTEEEKGEADRETH